MNNPPPSNKKSLTIFSVEEEEMEAISFERIGINTMHYKDRTSIISAKYADVTTCLGEIRPNTGVEFEPVPIPSIYGIDVDDVLVRNQVMVIRAVAKSSGGDPIGTAGDHITVIHQNTNDVIGIGLVTGNHGNLVANIGILYAASETGNKIKFRYYTSSTSYPSLTTSDQTLSNNSISVDIRFNLEGGGTPET